MDRRGLTGAAAVALAAVVVLAVAGLGDAGLAGTRSGGKKSGAAKTESARGYMGIYMQTLTSDVRAGLDLKGVDEGVLVSDVEDDSPADEAGLKDGDVIVTFNGAAVATPDELRAKVRDAGAGSKATVEYVRDGKKQAVELTLGERPGVEYGFHRMMQTPEIAHAFAMIGGPRLGIQAHDIESDDMASYFGVKPGEGVLVLGVDEDSPAGKAGVKPGDVVQKIGDESVASVDDIRDACRGLDEGDEFTIAVRRHGKTQSLKATMDETGPVWAFNSDDGDWQGWRHHAPRALVLPRSSQEDLRRELDQLKREMEELRQKLEKSDG